MERVIPYLNGLDMEKLSKEIIGKPRNMIDEEFAELEFITA